MKQSDHLVTTWKLTNLLKKHESNTRAREITSSITNPMRIFEYHSRIARDEVSKIKKDDPVAAFALIIPPSEKARDIEIMKVAIQANIQACMHISIPLYDMFAQLVNELVFVDKINVHDCSIDKIITKHI